MKVCKDGRIWGQNNKGASSHLGIITGRKVYIKKGETHSKSVTGIENPFYGKRHSIKTKKQMSKSAIGDKNHEWRGGISSVNSRIRRSIEFRLWREAVFARDNWTCQECGKRGGRLQPHHIKSFKEYPELRLALDNGKTLCLDCHKLTKNYAGKLNKREVSYV